MDDIKMGSVGPDDDFNEEEFAAPISNVTPIGVARLPKQGGRPVIAVEDDNVLKTDAVSQASGKRRVSNIIDVIENTEEVRDVIKDILPEGGMLFLGGQSATGKTILAIQFVANLVRGLPTMTWQLGEAAEDIRALMLSLEMPTGALQRRLRHMYPSLSDDEKKVLEERFKTYSESEPVRLWDANDCLDLIRMIKEHKINLLLIDSASVSLAESLKDDTQVNAAFRNLYRIRARLGVTVVMVAHTRKPPPGIESRPEEVTHSELFGHSGVAQQADAIVIMLEDEKHRKATFKAGEEESTEKLVHIINVKSRFGVNGGGFKAWLTAKDDVDKGNPLQFKRNAIPIEMTEEARERVAKTLKKSKLSDAFSDVDFGSIIGNEEE